MKNENDNSLELGKPMPVTAKYLDSTHTLISVNGNNLLPSRQIEFKGLKYRIVTNDSGSIIFIKTSDKKFISKEGFKIGMLYKDLQRGEYKTNLIPGFSYNLILSHGWEAVLSDEYFLNNGFPADTSKIVSFTKSTTN